MNRSRGRVAVCIEPWRGHIDVLECARERPEIPERTGSDLPFLRQLFHLQIALFFRFRFRFRRLDHQGAWNDPAGAPSSRDGAVIDQAPIEDRAYGSSKTPSRFLRWTGTHCWQASDRRKAGTIVRRMGPTRGTLFSLRGDTRGPSSRHTSPIAVGLPGGFMALDSHRRCLSRLGRPPLSAATLRYKRS
jgi:hypothetical protein